MFILSVAFQSAHGFSAFAAKCFPKSTMACIIIFFSPSGLLCVTSCKVMIMMGVTVMMMVAANFT